ncbi:MAG: deoxyribose-phosphate aldolase [Nitrospira sp.]|nr:deoxyribose-phosphate aldolase [Nitrospira sp.]
MFKDSKELAQLIDHTLLKPEATTTHIGRLCDEAVRYSFVTVCVAPCYVEMAVSRLKETAIRVCSVVGFPLGNSSISVKIVEAMEALKHGANELDMVINLGALKSGNEGYVKNEVLNLVNVCQKAVLKIILETGALTPEEIVRGARWVLEAGAKWVKTSTGFNYPGATAKDVRLLKKTIGDRGFVKASGGIHTLAAVESMLKAGASRIGTSHGVSIMREYLYLKDHAARSTKRSS